MGSHAVRGRISSRINYSLLLNFVEIAREISTWNVLNRSFFFLYFLSCFFSSFYRFLGFVYKKMSVCMVLECIKCTNIIASLECYFVIREVPERPKSNEEL